MIVPALSTSSGAICFVICFTVKAYLCSYCLTLIVSVFDAAYAMVLVYKSRQEMSSSLFDKTD